MNYILKPNSDAGKAKLTITGGKTLNDLLIEVLNNRRMSVYGAEKEIGISYQAVYDIIHGKLATRFHANTLHFLFKNLPEKEISKVLKAQSEFVKSNKL